MLTPNKDGLLHLRDVHAEPIHVRRLADLGYLRASDLTDEESVIKAVESFIADASFRLLEEANEHPKPVKLRPRTETLNLLQRFGWLSSNDAYDLGAIAAAIEDLVEFALLKRLDADDVAKEQALEALVQEQRVKARNAPVTGWGAKAEAGLKDMFNRQAAAAE